MEADLVVLGGGPAGVYAALRVRELGGRAVLVEREHLGGTCLHRGCVPTVASLQAAHLRRAQLEGATWGLAASTGAPDLETLRHRRDRTVRHLQTATQDYLREAGVEVLLGTGRVTGPRSVEVEERSGRQVQVTGRALLLAVGAGFSLPELPGIDSPGVWTTDHALDATHPPGELAVLGGNFIGIEWAQFFQTMGSRVVLLEPGPHLLPGEDAEIAEVLQFILEQGGLEVRLNWAPEVFSQAGPGRVSLRGPAGELQADRVLIADCRRPLVHGLPLADLGVETVGGAVAVDDRQATGAQGIYAAGDVTGGMMLSQAARAQGVVAAENMMGLESRFDPAGCPRAYHTVPEVAAVGLTEAQAAEAGLETVAGRAEIGFNARALTLGKELGMVKVVAARPHGKVVGVHMVGPLATEVIGQAVLALRLEALAEDLAGLVHGHPTVAEALAEAAQDAARQL